MGTRLQNNPPLPRGMKERGIKFLVCFSAANLLFMNAWFELYPGTADQYLQGFTATFPAIAALWTNILLLTGLCFIGHSLVRQTRWILPLALLGGLVVITSLLDPSRRLLTQYSPIFEPVLMIRALGFRSIFGIAAVVLALITGLVYWKPRLVYRTIKISLLALAPLPLFFTWTVARSVPSSSLPIPQPNEGQPGSRPTKAVVLIFDEWDYEYGFPQRPSWIHLPNIDRFSNEYGSYLNCWPPAGETLRSIPSLITGNHWLGARPAIDGKIMLKDNKSLEWKAWSDTDDLFKTLSKLGWKTHMIQWWHVFSNSYLQQRPGLSVSHYAASPDWQEPREAYRTFTGSFRRSWLRMFRSFQAYLRLVRPKNAVPARVVMVNRMMEELLYTASSRRHDFIWAHLPYPHAPAVVDAKTGAYLSHPDPGISNLDNMVLADRTLGRLRSQMEAQGDWERSLVVLTADHWQRENNGDHLPLDPRKYSRDEGFRVPLLVKWPNQTEPWVIHEPVSNLSIRGMIEAVAEGKSPGRFFKMTPPPPDKRYYFMHPDNH